MKLTENSPIMATIRECQGKAMDAKAVANEIYLRHSMSVTEEQVLHAQAWLQDELKLTEPQPVTEKKTENTTSTTTVSTKSEANSTTSTTPPTMPDNVQKVVEKVVPATPEQRKIELIIPEGMSEIPPILIIDDLIRRGYRDRDDLEAFMKEKFKGKAYRKDVLERLALFEARQTPFNDIPRPQDTTAATTSSTTSPTMPSPQNTAVLQASGAVPALVAGAVPAVVETLVPAVVAAVSEQPADLPDVLKAAHALTDEQAISSLQTGFLTAFQQPVSRSMMRPINLPQSNSTKC